MGAIVRAWERFWFDRTPTSTVALVRIAFGVLALFWTLSLAPDLMTFFSKTGLLRHQIGGRWEWGLLRSFPSTPAVIGLFILLLVGSACLIVGFRPRIASIVVFLGIMSFERRNPYIFNAGDGLVRLLALYVVFLPTDAALSLDRWRKNKDRFWEFPLRSQWGLRIIQVQTAFLYAGTVWAKLRGTDWNDGTAVSYAVRLGDYIRFRVPKFIWNSEWIVNLLTFGTLAIEFSLAYLVWNKRARPWVLWAGALLHVGIALSVQIGFFTMAVLVLYLSFIPPETAARWVELVRSRIFRSRRRPAPAAVAS